MDKMYKQRIMSGQQEPETWEKTEPEQSKEPVSLKRFVTGTRYTEHEWLGRAVRGAIPRGTQDGEPITECPRWVAVRDAFSCGSTYAVALCKEFDLDPHDTISR